MAEARLNLRDVMAATGGEEAALHEHYLPPHWHAGRTMRMMGADGNTWTLETAYITKLPVMITFFLDEPDDHAMSGFHTIFDIYVTSSITHWMSQLTDFLKEFLDDASLPNYTKTTGNLYKNGIYRVKSSFGNINYVANHREFITKVAYPPSGDDVISCITPFALEMLKKLQYRLNLMREENQLRVSQHYYHGVFLYRSGFYDDEHLKKRFPEEGCVVAFTNAKENCEARDKLDWILMSLVEDELTVFLESNMEVFITIAEMFGSIRECAVAKYNQHVKKKINFKKKQT